MSSPEKTWEKNPLQNLAEGTVDKPGMYLIALRAHLNRGKTIIRDVFESVSDALPSSTKAGSTEHSS
jgi:hypothetical protein